MTNILKSYDKKGTRMIENVQKYLGIKNIYILVTRKGKPALIQDRNNTGIQLLNVNLLIKSHFIFPE